MRHVNVNTVSTGCELWDINRSTCVQSKQAGGVLQGYRERKREVDEQSPLCGEGSRGQPGPLR